MDSKSDDKFSEQKTRERFEAALRGARLAGPKHKKTVSPSGHEKISLAPPSRARLTVHPLRLPVLVSSRSTHLLLGSGVGGATLP
jgi:hypothetical protein